VRGGSAFMVVWGGLCLWLCVGVCVYGCVGGFAFMVVWGFAFIIYTSALVLNPQPKSLVVQAGRHPPGAGVPLPPRGGGSSVDVPGSGARLRGERAGERLLLEGWQTTIQQVKQQHQDQIERRETGQLVGRRARNRVRKLQQNFQCPPEPGDFSQEHIRR